MIHILLYAMIYDIIIQLFWFLMDIVEFRHSERFGFQNQNWRSISPVYQFLRLVFQS